MDIIMIYMCHIQIWYNQFDFQANQLTTTKNWFEHEKNDGAFDMQKNISEFIRCNSNKRFHFLHGNCA